MQCLPVTRIVCVKNPAMMSRSSVVPVGAAARFDHPAQSIWCGNVADQYLVQVTEKSMRLADVC